MALEARFLRAGYTVHAGAPSKYNAALGSGFQRARTFTGRDTRRVPGAGRLRHNANLLSIDGSTGLPSYTGNRRGLSSIFFTRWAVDWFRVLRRQAPKDLSKRRRRIYRLRWGGDGKRGLASR